jgi:hypothetical protein
MGHPVKEEVSRIKAAGLDAWSRVVRGFRNT